MGKLTGSTCALRAHFDNPCAPGPQYRPALVPSFHVCKVARRAPRAADDPWAATAARLEVPHKLASGREAEVCVQDDRSRLAIAVCIACRERWEMACYYAQHTLVSGGILQSRRLWKCRLCGSSMVAAGKSSRWRVCEQRERSEWNSRKRKRGLTIKLGIIVQCGADAHENRVVEGAHPACCTSVSAPSLRRLLGIMWGSPVCHDHALLATQDELLSAYTCDLCIERLCER